MHCSFNNFSNQKLHGETSHDCWFTCSKIFSISHILKRYLYFSRSLECLYKSIEFGLPNLANACGFTLQPFTISEQLWQIWICFTIFSGPLKNHPPSVSTCNWISIPSSWRFLSARVKSGALDRWGITDGLPKTVHFKWSWVRCLFLSHYFPRQSWRCKKWREVFHLHNWWFHFEKQWFVGCIPGGHRWKWRSLDPKRAKEEIHEEGICKSRTHRHHPFNIFQSKAIR